MTKTACQISNEAVDEGWL